MFKGKKFNYRALVVIILPIAALFIVFSLYKKMNKQDEKIVSEQHEAILIPDVSDTSETMHLKSEIYEREKREKENEDYEKNRKRFGISDFFSLSNKEEKDTVEKDTVKSFFDMVNKDDDKKESLKSFSKSSTSSGTKKRKVSKSIQGNQNEEKKPIYLTKYEDKEKDEKETEEKKVLERTRKTGSGGFTEKKISKSKNIYAVLNNYDREIRNGATLVFRLIEDFVIGDRTIKKNTLIYGIASFTAERVKVAIQSVKFGNEIIPVNMVVHDMDGIEGIYIPGGIDQEIAEESADDAISGGSEVSISVPIIGSIGTKIAKKKVKNPTVKVQDGYKVLLVLK